MNVNNKKQVQQEASQAMEGYLTPKQFNVEDEKYELIINEIKTGHLDATKGAEDTLRAAKKPPADQTKKKGHGSTSKSNGKVEMFSSQQNEPKQPLTPFPDDDDA